DEIMRCFVQLVNPSFFTPFNSHLHAPFCGEANYSKPGMELASPFRQPMTILAGRSAKNTLR
ncbi:MAG: hypothetical protein V4578_23955, partial [Pseudomonadota bacterium]